MIIVIIFMVFPILAGYISARGFYAITKITWLSTLMVFLPLCFVFSFIDASKFPKFDWLLNALSYIGYVYVGFAVYFAIFCIFTFVFAQFYSEINLPKILTYGLCGVVAILWYGYICAMNPRIKTISIPSDKQLRICFVSDIHVSCIGTEKILSALVDLINKINPDVVIIGGDSMDPKALTLYKSEFENTFRKITSMYKTYAIIGNHEIYAGPQKCIDLLKKSGVSMLLDESIDIRGFTVVGRIDRMYFRRKSLKQILEKKSSERVKENSNGKNPLIVIDHAPDAISESVENRALLHLSGHTHGGQMFPMNLLVNLKYPKTGVLEKIRETYSYITYGIGFWGPPYRIGTHSEVVLVEFKK